MNFDLRRPIGAMFTLLGAMLVFYGVISRPEIHRALRSACNVNLIWGAVLLIFGGSISGSAVTQHLPDASCPDARLRPAARSRPSSRRSSPTSRRAAGAARRGPRRTRCSVRKRLARRLRELGLASLGEHRRRLDAWRAPLRSDEWLWLDQCAASPISRFARRRRLRGAARMLACPSSRRRRGRAQQQPEPWSAGAASGEEAYGLAVAWHIEHRAALSGAGDRCARNRRRPDVVLRARGIYPKASLRELPRRCAPRSSRADTSGGCRALSPRGSVSNTPTCGASAARARSTWCCGRNLAFTYFDEPTQRRLAREPAASLQPGGPGGQARRAAAEREREARQAVGQSSMPETGRAQRAAPRAFDSGGPRASPCSLMGPGALRDPLARLHLARVGTPGLEGAVRFEDDPGSCCRSRASAPSVRPRVSSSGDGRRPADARARRGGGRPGSAAPVRPQAAQALGQSRRAARQPARARG